MPALIETLGFGSALDATWVVAAVSIVASSLFYTWIWYRPEQFKALIAPADPCKSMALLANVIKVAQIGSLVALTDWSALHSLSQLQLFLSLALIAYGQHLNFLVYKHLGVDGVYYGSRFGRSLPWVTAYPYNAIKDPQYVGCVITLIGAAFVVPFHAIAWWFVNYMYLMWLESAVPTGIAKVAATLH